VPAHTPSSAPSSALAREDRRTGQPAHTRTTSRERR
jgi:hypothetical protein